MKHFSDPCRKPIYQWVWNYLYCSYPISYFTIFTLSFPLILSASFFSFVAHSNSTSQLSRLQTPQKFTQPVRHVSKMPGHGYFKVVVLFKQCEVHSSCRMPIAIFISSPFAGHVPKRPQWGPDNDCLSRASPALIAWRRKHHHVTSTASNFFWIMCWLWHVNSSTVVLLKVVTTTARWQLYLSNLSSVHHQRPFNQNC